jgi:hypothetical protein
MLPQEAVNVTPNQNPSALFKGTTSIILCKALALSGALKNRDIEGQGKSES